MVLSVENSYGPVVRGYLFKDWVIYSQIQVVLVGDLKIPYLRLYRPYRNL